MFWHKPSDLACSEQTPRTALNAPAQLLMLAGCGPAAGVCCAVGVGRHTGVTQVGTAPPLSHHHQEYQPHPHPHPHQHRQGGHQQKVMV